MSMCPICCEEDSYLKKLSCCQAGLCVGCLEKLEAGNKYRCPFCNEETVLPSGGIGELPDADVPAVEPSEDSAFSDVTDTEQLLNRTLHKARDALRLAEQKIERCSLQQCQLRQEQELIEERIYESMGNVTSDAYLNLENKIDAIGLMTSKKQETSAKREKQLKSAFVRLKEQVSSMSSNGKGLSMKKLKKVKKSFERNIADLSCLLSPPENGFKAGDNVTLSLSSNQLTDDFLQTELTHASVGYIYWLDRNQDKCQVIFEEFSHWEGQTSELESTNLQHNLPTFLSKVTLKSSTHEPHFGWQGISPNSLGVVTKFTDDSLSHQRVIEVDFPENHQWRGLFDELILAKEDSLQIGDLVSIKSNIKEPKGGWKGFDHSVDGLLKSLYICGTKAVVELPNGGQWTGRKSDLEKSRPITIGDLVQVKVQCGNDSETPVQGCVMEVHNHKDHGETATLTLWNPHQGILEIPVSELELVKRCCNSFRVWRQINGYQVLAPYQLVCPCELRPFEHPTCMCRPITCCKLFLNLSVVLIIVMLIFFFIYKYFF